MTAALAMSAVTTGYGRKILLSDLDLEIASGDVLSILGPNGVGKTTLLRAITGLSRPLSGEVRIMGRELRTIPFEERAKLVALVSQTESMTFSLTVLDTVLMGRAAHLGFFNKPGPKDIAIALASLAEMGVDHLAQQEMPSLSGGQRQMVRIARALAQQAKIVILDEPTSHLDIANQLQVLGAIRRLRECGMTIILTTHDPEHAIVCGGKVLALFRGGKFAIGEAAELLDEKLLETVFSIAVTRVATDDHDILIAPRYNQILSNQTK